MEFRVEQNGFCGPIDLLLYLVRNQEVDILQFALADIVGQYLEMIETLRLCDLDDVGEFLVLASMLMEYKSRAMMPRFAEVEADDEDEQPRQELVRQLLEYKRFKQASALLWQRALDRQSKLGRQVSDLGRGSGDAALRPIRELELWDLVSAFSRLLKENIVPVAESVARDPTPVSVYMDQLEEQVLRSGGITFRSLLGTTNTRPRLIGKFLALLELIKARRIWVEWSADGEEIEILPASAAPPPESLPSVPMADESVPPDAMVDSTGLAPASERPEAVPDDESFDDDLLDSGTTRGSAWADFESVLDDEDEADEEE